MSLIDVLKPQHFEITMPARLVRFGEKDKDLSIQERIINEKLMELDRKISRCRFKNDDLKSKINKLSKKNPKDIRLKIFKNDKMEIMRTLEALRKKRISLCNKIKNE